MEKENKEVKEIELTEKQIEKIAQTAQKASEENVAEEVNKILDKKYAEKEQAQKKALETKEKEFSSMDTKVKLNKMLHALINKDVQTLSLMKDYLRTGSNPGAGYLIAPPDFTKEIYDLENEYGVARRFCRVYTPSSNSATVPVVNTTVSVSQTDEAGTKPISTPTWSQVTVTLDKYTAITPITDEMIEDSAFDLMGLIADQYANEFAETEDGLVFTNATTGIVNQANVHEITTTTTAITSVTLANINQLIYEVPTKSRKNGRFYMNPKVLGVLQRIQSTDGIFLYQQPTDRNPNGSIWGYPIELTEALPSTLTASADTAFIVFGDLKYCWLIEKNGMKLEVFNQGTVVDGQATYNLIQQDMKAMRAVKRVNAQVIMDTAFGVIKTAPASS